MTAMKRHANDDFTDVGAKRAAKRLRIPTDDQSTTPDNEARAGLQRSLCLVLDHVGFDSATPGALDGFTAMVETYMASLIEDVKQRSLACRREHPTPADFSFSFRRFNLPTDLLQPHRRTPIPRAILAPPRDDDSDHVSIGPAAALPLLCSELDGQGEKASKRYIPPSFPNFPSLHTYRYSPTEEPADSDAAVPGRIREAAAKSAKEGEDALRKLVRAAKIRNQKEARTVADRDVNGRERYRLWDGAMKGLLQDLAPPTSDGAPSQLLADQGTIVNSEASFLRREIVRGGKRAGAGAAAIRNEGRVSG